MASVIRFNCPKCDAELEVANQTAGSKVVCPECGERLLVPASARKSSSGMTAVPPRSKAAAPAPKRRRDSREEEPEEGSSKTVLILGACAGGSVLLLVIALGLFFAFREKSDADKPVVTGPPAPKFQEPAPAQPAAKSAPQDTPRPAEKKVEDPLAGLGSGGPVSGKDVYKYLLKSVVWVVVPVGNGGASFGTGSLVDKERRLVLTNNHVVAPGQVYLVLFPTYENGELVTSRDVYLKKLQANSSDAIQAQVLSKDERRDLALLQLSRVPDGFEAITLAKQSPEPGENVYSVGGSPAGSNALWPLTTGQVRQVVKQQWKAQGGNGQVFDLEAKVVLATSPTNPGDSGGPLVNDRGEQVGVTQGGSRTANNLSFFVDVTEAHDFLKKHYLAVNAPYPPQTRPLLAAGGGGAGLAQVPDLIKLLDHGDASVRAKAARMLGEAGPSARNAIASLLKLLKDPDDFTRRTAAEALNKLGPPGRDDLRLLTTALKDSAVEVRVYAASALGKMGADARHAAPALVEALQDSDAGVRQSAARSLAKVGTDSKDTVFPALLKAVGDSERDVRQAAAEALSACGPLSAADVPALVGLLKHQDAEVRVQALKALGKMGRDGKAALPNVLEACKGTADLGTRRAAVEALGPLGADAKAAVPVLIEALKESDKDLRRDAIVVLAKFGPDAKPASAALGAALKDADKDVRKNAAVALGKLGPGAKDTLPYLVEGLKDKDKEVLLAVLTALATAGPDTKGVTVVDLIGLFENSDAEVRNKAALAVGKVGKAAVKPLTKALSDASSDVRGAAATALGEMGAAARDQATLRALALHAEADQVPEVRSKCADALRKIRGGL
jgi:HEAT repeat protein/S1-C subfamily serine protease